MVSESKPKLSTLPRMRREQFPHMLMVSVPVDHKPFPAEISLEGAIAYYLSADAVRNVDVFLTTRWKDRQEYFDGVSPLAGNLQVGAVTESRIVPLTGDKDIELFPDASTSYRLRLDSISVNLMALGKIYRDKSLWTNHSDLYYLLSEIQGFKNMF